VALVDEHTRRPTTPVVVAGAALVVVVLVALAVIVLGGNDDDRRRTRSPSGGESQPASKNSSLTAGNVTFNDVYGVQVPSSSAGPGHTDDGRALGFDHSPSGAVLAAIHIFARVESRPGPAVFEPTIREQVVGPDKDKLLAKARSGYAEGAIRGTSPDGSLRAAIEEARRNQIGMWAYRVDAYDNSSAAVNVLLRQVVPGTSSYAYFNFPFTVRWIDADWRLVVPLNGEFSSVIRRVPEVPAGYLVVGKD
jgi:hypothetical protein